MSLADKGDEGRERVTEIFSETDHQPDISSRVNRNRLERSASRTMMVPPLDHRKDWGGALEQKIKISVDADGVTLIGNRRGLIGLAEVCQWLADLPEDREQSRELGNHYHYAEWMNNAEPGSVPLEILYDPDL